MDDYYDLLEEVREYGHSSNDRTNTGTLSLFGRQMRFDLQEGFPLLTGKFTSFKNVATELLWFIDGKTNIADLHQHNNHIWDAWADSNGDLGPIYGAQWRTWPIWERVFSENEPVALRASGIIDQVTDLMEGLKKKPNSRRHIVSAWNPEYLPDESLSPQENVAIGKMALAPCHMLFQFHVRRAPSGRKFLSCRVDQRSADLFLGVPYNIASYALLTHMVAHVTDMTPDELIWHGGDCHIYKNHLEQVDELLHRDPTEYPLPTLEIKSKIHSIDHFSLESFDLIGYKSHPAIKAPVAV